MEKEYNDDSQPIYKNINESFINLIGYISIITHIYSYKDSWKDYNYILNIILDWAAKYELTRDLSFIDDKVINEVYKKLDDLQTKFICNDSLGHESELSDFACNWLWHLMVLRRNFLIKKSEIQNGN